MRFFVLTAVLSLFCGAAPAQAQQSTPPDPCAASEQRQFDFWMGEWDASWPGNKDGEVQHGTNSIRRLLDGCVVEENFSGGPDTHLRGKSVSIFDTRAGKWKQTWVDNEGGYLDFVGEFKDGQMILSREVSRLDGTKAQQRMVSKTSPQMPSTGAGNLPRTTAKPGRCSGPFTTSGGSSFESRRDELTVGWESWLTKIAWFRQLRMPSPQPPERFIAIRTSRHASASSAALPSTSASGHGASASAILY